MKIKKFLLILLVFLGVCFINTDNIYALKGDANKDGKIDCADYSTLKKFVNGTNIEISKTNADVNSDGIVNQKDFEDWETRMGIICRPATEQDFLGELTCGETDFKFHQSLPKFTATIYDVLKIATPIIVIVTGMIDLLKAVTSQKEDEIKKAQQKFVRRLIAGAIVFLVFVILEIFINIIAEADDSNNAMDCVNTFLHGPSYCGGNGDANNDKKVDYRDLNFMLLYFNKIGEIENFNKNNANINCSSNGFDSNDVNVLWEKLSKNGSKKIGDANNDGIVDHRDVETIENYFLNRVSAHENNTINLVNADMNNNYSVNEDDLNALRSLITDKIYNDNQNIGDVNSDGKINYIDLDILIQNIIGNDKSYSYNSSNSDLNGDAKVTEEDIEYLFELIADSAVRGDFDGDKQITKNDCDLWNRYSHKHVFTYYDIQFLYKVIKDGTANETYKGGETWGTDINGDGTINMDDYYAILIFNKHTADMDFNGKINDNDKDIFFASSGSVCEPDIDESNITFSYEYNKDNASMPYGLFTPSSASNSNKSALIVWFHGYGEDGKSASALRNSGFLNILESDWKNWGFDGFNAYVLCPHLQTGRWENGSNPDNFKKLLEKIKKEKNIDTNKIVLIGHSKGSQAVQYYGNLSNSYSALVALSGYVANSTDLSKIDKNKVLGYTGTNDEQNTVNYMKKTFANYFNIINLQGANHGGVVTKAFEQDKNNNNKSDLIEWMLADNNKKKELEKFMLAQ